MHQLIDKKNKIVIYLLFLVILSTTCNKNISQQKNYNIVINEIEISGLSINNNLQLKEKLDNFFYKNIFFLRKEEINSIILKYNIIEEYNIKKIYPSKLDIDVKPTKFIAKISNNNRLLVGSNGKLIENEITNETLPYIFGKFDSKEFLEFKEIIERSKFNFVDLKSIFFYSSKRLDILTIDEILIKLPKNNLLKSLNVANKIIVDNQFKDNKIIDLRISNHIIIQ
jgi:cell division protein FtsQ